MKKMLRLTAVLLTVVALIGACSEDDPATYCICWCDCGTGNTKLDANGSAECTDRCQTTCGANYSADYECPE